MKIKEVKVLFPQKGRRVAVGVRILTDEGIYGDGEVAGIHASYASFGMLRDLAPSLIGRNPLDNEVIWDDIFKASFWGQNGGPAFFAAVGAIDIALWDIKGKYYNAPVWELLGGKKRTKLRAYASQLQCPWTNQNWQHDTHTPEAFAANAKYCVEKLGYDCIKIDFFDQDRDGNALDSRTTNGLLKADLVDMIVERVTAVREAIGPKVDLIMENHSFTDAQSAIQLAHAVEPYNIFFFEEPSTPSPKVIKFIKDNIKLPLAQGERVYSRWQFAPYFEQESVQIIQPDMGNCGGITETKKICDMAYVYDVGVQLHVCGSHLMTPAALHVESVIPNFVIHEHHVNTQFPDNRAFTNKTFEPVNGYFDIPNDPGIGIEWSDFTLSCEEQITYK